MYDKRRTLSTSEREKQIMQVFIRKSRAVIIIQEEDGKTAQATTFVDEACKMH